MANPVAPIFTEQSIDPLTKLIATYGAPAACVIFLVVGIWFVSTSQKAPGWFCLVVSLLFASASVYVFIYPPTTVFAHEMSIRLRLPNQDANLVRPLVLSPTDDDVWIKSANPSITDDSGQTKFTWTVMVLAGSTIPSGKALHLRVVWKDRWDEVESVSAGGHYNACELKPIGGKKIADLLSVEGGGRVFDNATCRKVDEMTRAAWNWPFATSAYAADGIDFSQMNKAELVELLKKIDTLNPDVIREATAPSAPPVPVVPTTDSPRVSYPVVYWQKKSDAGLVRDTLLKSGIKPIEKEAKLEQPTNAFWFGTGVEPATAKAIAKRLIQSGVKLQHFGHFDDPGAKTNTIELGHSGANSAAPVLTVDDVERASFADAVP